MAEKRMNDKTNHGQATSKTSTFTNRVAYGKDSSGYTGSASDERGGSLKGGVHDLSRTISSGSVGKAD